MENTITSERPINEVFKYVSTPENDPAWVAISLWHERKAPGPMRGGTTTEEDVAIFGRKVRYTWEVTEYDPPTGIAYRAPSGLLPGAAIRLRLEPVEGGTKLTHAIDLEPRGNFYKAIAPLIPWVAQRPLDSLDRTLKKLLEDKETRSRSAPGTMAWCVVAATVVALLFLRRRNHRSESRARCFQALR